MSRQGICPEILPIFPLTGAILLPGGRLPLHVFEERYRNMVEDALDGDGFIGMIQPQTPAPEVDPREAAELYSVGCAGLIERWESLDDGRYIILLKGIARFRVGRELAAVRGYRRVEADYEGFADDLDEEGAEVESAQLMQALKAFGEAHQVPIELDKLAELSGLALLNSLAMALPFQPAEKQALLEAPDVEHRLETLLALMNMGIELRPDSPPPVLN
jgi:Lon protease-like protein